MRQIRFPLALLAAASAAVLLAACSGGDGSQAGGSDAAGASGGEADQAAAPADSGGEEALAAPARKGGLWKVTMNGPQTVSMSQCVDASTDNLTAPEQPNADQSACTKPHMQRQAGGGFEFSSTCDVGNGGKVETKGVVTGDMSSHYTMTITSTTTNAANPGMSAAQTMTITGDYQGPCPSGMAAGDMMLPGGQIMHMPAPQ